jgi:hypothetical protein
MIRKPTRIELRVEDEMQELEEALRLRQPHNKKALSAIVNPANQFLRLQAQSTLSPDRHKLR